MIRQVYIEDGQVVTESNAAFAARVFQVPLEQVTQDMLDRIRTMMHARLFANCWTTSAEDGA